jgi:hypothetical protein
MRVRPHDGRRRRLDEVDQVGIRIAPAKGPDHRSREDDVTDEPQSDQEDTHGRNGLVLHARLVDEHDRDIVLHWVHATAFLALEARPVLDEVDRGLAVGANQDLEKRGVDSHAAI